MWFNKFISELQRRNVIRAAISFIAVSWVILQAVSIIFPAYGLSASGIRLVLFVFIILFPFWLIFAWIYDYTPEGLIKTDDIPEASPRSDQQTHKSQNVLIIGSMALAILLLLSDRIFNISERILGEIGIQSIAVLPFDNLSGDPEQAFFVEGMQDELIGQLASLGSLRVISRTSTLKYQNSRLSIPEVANELGVEALVDGSVMKFGDSVRIQVQLIKTKPSETHLWNNSYNRDIRNVLKMHSNVTKDIARSINLILTPSQEIKLNQSKEVDPRAYEALLKGRFHVFRFTPSDVNQGMQYFESALEIDPNYAEAYAEICITGGFMTVLGMMPPGLAGKLMQENAERSLQLDSLSARSHFALAGSESWYGFNWDIAEKAWKRSLELNPNDATVQIYYSFFLASMGKMEEAKHHGNMALELDPFNAFFHGLYASVLDMAGENDAAEAKCNEALEMNPHNPFPLLGLSSLAAESGDLKKTHEYLEMFFTAVGDTVVLNALAWKGDDGNYRDGFFKAAMEMENRWKSHYVQPQAIVRFYDLAGQTDNALDWLDTCYLYKDHIMGYLKTLTLSNQLKTDPRYLELVEKMNFPVENNDNADR